MVADRFRVRPSSIGVRISLVGPVPINSRIAKWTPQSLPGDWQAQEHRWVSLIGSEPAASSSRSRCLFSVSASVESGS